MNELQEITPQETEPDENWSLEPFLEWIAFYTLVILNMLPAIASPYLPTLDGPAHLYNANLITRLGTGSQFLAEHLSFNGEVVPNWGGHFFLIVFNGMMSPEAASKLFIGLCVFLLPVSFRYCVRRLNPESMLGSYLIFPFTYTLNFLLGFYNFHVGLIILFFTIGVLIDFRNKPIRKSRVLLLFFLVLSAYLSHLFTFLTLGLFIAGFCVLDIIHALAEKKPLKLIFRKTGLLLLVCALPLLLAARHFLLLHDTSNPAFLPTQQLLQWLLDLQSAVVYSKEQEIPYTRTIAITIGVLFIAAVRLRFRQLGEKAEHRSFLRKIVLKIRIQDLFLLLAIAFTVLYFKLPDATPSAGFVSVRFNLLLFLFVILWAATFRFANWIILPALAVIFYAHYELVNYRKEPMHILSRHIREIIHIEKSIRPNTVILPLNYSQNWIEQHQSNYLGIRKPLIILDNYEAYNNYFPLRWKPDHPLFDLTHSNFSRFDLILQNTPPELFERIDYIFVQEKALFPDSLKEMLENMYNVEKSTKHYLLLERKR